MILIRFVVTLAILYLLYRLVKGLMRLSRDRSGQDDRRPALMKGEDLVEDPCCGVNIPVSQAYRAVIEGRTVYFCSRECYEKFKKK